MRYMEAVFWIESGYDAVNGWPDKEIEFGYYRELRGLLESVGWNIIEPQTENPYPIAQKGEEWLELRPSYLHGAIGQETPKQIGKLFSMAKAFRYQRIEVLSQVVDLSGQQYLMKLKTQQEPMAKDILRLCNTKSEEDFVAAEAIYKAIKNKYHIQRTGEFGEDVILKGVFKNLLSIMAIKGELQEGKARNGESGYRSILLSTEKAA